jgi:uncharacterized membrane protein
MFGTTLAAFICEVSSSIYRYTIAIGARRGGVNDIHIPLMTSDDVTYTRTFLIETHMRFATLGLSSINSRFWDVLSGLDAKNCRKVLGIYT